MADIQWGREERETRGRGAETERRGQEARGSKHLTEVGVVEKRERRDKSDTEIDKYTQGGVKTATSQSHSIHKKGHMTNIYLTDLDEETIMDFVKFQEELYDKTNEHFMDKPSKECLLERFTKKCKLSVKVCKTLFELQRTHYGMLTQSSLDRPQKR